MTYYKILLLNIFVSVAICGSTNSQDTESSHSASNHANNFIRTSKVPSDIAEVKDKVKIEVYYETLCPFSVKFFVSQLKPAMERLGSYLDIHLIPYGNARTRLVSGHYRFRCQHGFRECFGNTVQACAIDVLRNTTRAVYFNTCLMQYASHNMDFQYFRTVFNWCGYQEKVAIKEIWKCVSSKRGSVLLKRFGDDTHAIATPYVPYLMIDGSRAYQVQATENLISTVCRMLRPTPIECSSVI